MALVDEWGGPDVVTYHASLCRVDDVARGFGDTPAEAFAEAVERAKALPAAEAGRDGDGDRG